MRKPCKSPKRRRSGRCVLPKKYRKARVSRRSKTSVTGESPSWVVTLRGVSGKNRSEKKARALRLVNACKAMGVSLRKKKGKGFKSFRTLVTQCGVRFTTRNKIVTKTGATKVMAKYLKRKVARRRASAASKPEEFHDAVQTLEFGKRRRKGSKRNKRVSKIGPSLEMLKYLKRKAAASKPEEFHDAVQTLEFGKRRRKGSKRNKRVSKKTGAILEMLKYLNNKAAARRRAAASKPEEFHDSVQTLEFGKRRRKGSKKSPSWFVTLKGVSGKNRSEKKARAFRLIKACKAMGVSLLKKNRKTFKSFKSLKNQCGVRFTKRNKIVTKSGATKVMAKYLKRKVARRRAAASASESSFGRRRGVVRRRYHKATKECGGLRKRVCKSNPNCTYVKRRGCRGRKHTVKGSRRYEGPSLAFGRLLY